MNFFAWILLETFLGMCWASIIPTTSRLGQRIVPDGSMILCCSGCCLKYQLVFFCVEQIYCALTTNSPSEIIYPSIVVLFFSVYASEMNLITHNLFAVVSSVLMGPYLPYWTNKSILSLIPSRTTWCISSNASKDVDFGDRWMIFQLLYEPRTGQ